MLDLTYLIDREREEELRVSTRDLAFPDSTTQRIEAYRLVWRWYDRLIECDVTHDEAEIIAMIPRCAEHEGLDYGAAFEHVITVLVGRLDLDGIDITDDTLTLQIARDQMAKWEGRKSAR